MKRLLILTLVALLVGAFAGCEKEKLITGPTEYDTTTVVDTFVMVDTLKVVDTVEVNILNELDYYYELQKWINLQLIPLGRDSYYPTVNTYDIKITINGPNQMTFDIWWPAFDFTANKVWYYRDLFKVVYGGPGNWIITLLNSTSSNHPIRQLPTQTLR